MSFVRVLGHDVFRRGKRSSYGFVGFLFFVPFVTCLYPLLSVLLLLIAKYSQSLDYFKRSLLVSHAV